MCVGLLLYRIRSCPVLYKISLGTYKRSEDGPRARDGTTGTKDPSELQEFLDSAQYLQLCLSTSPNRSMLAHSANQFRALQWTPIQNWMPKVLIMEHELKHGFATTNLVDLAWKLPENFAVEKAFSYRNIPAKSPAHVHHSSASSFLLRGASSSTSGGTGTGSNAAHSSIQEVCEIGECADVARGLAITLGNVLRKQIS